MLNIIQLVNYLILRFITTTIKKKIKKNWRTRASHTHVFQNIVSRVRMFCTYYTRAILYQSPLLKRANSSENKLNRAQIGITEMSLKISLEYNIMSIDITVY